METLSGWYNRQIREAEESRFAVLSTLVVLQSCIGSISAMYILQNGASAILLGTCAALTMSVNAAGLAVAPMRWIINLGIASIVINSLFISLL